MRYLLVDRIVEWKAGESIRGVKNVAMSEDYLEFHFPRNPVMPGALLLEALAQLAGWLEAASSDFQKWFLLQRVRHGMFYGFTFPGDAVELEVRKQGNTEEGEGFLGICFVGGRKKVVAEFSGRILPLEEIASVSAQKEFFQILNRGAK
jgi:3-hydroxyacyl-[acyl-carrier-protein] dehydratase